MQTIIKLLDKNNYSEYEKFLLSSERNLFFASTKYKDLLEELLDCESKYLVAYYNDEIIGALPLMYKSGPFGKVVNSLPFYGSNGGVIGINDEVKKLLIDKYHDLVQLNDVAASTLILNPFEGKSENFKNDFIDSRVGQISLLFEDDNEGIKLLESFHYKTRNMVKKSMKQGVDVKIDNSSFNFLYKTHVENMESIGGKKKDKKFFDLVPKYFTAEEDYCILTATKDNQLIAALLVFKYNKTIEYFTPVIKSEYRNLQPMSLIIYTAMIKFQNEGYKFWNWGGTWESQEGVYRFKSRWNAQDYPYEYYTIINNRDLLDTSQELLLEFYDGFFTVPFNQLRCNNEV